MSSTYSIKEIYYTLQGEGVHTGRAAIFLRFSGCNLWSGLEKDRNTAICQFCDTQFWGTDGELGGKYDAPGLAKKARSLFPSDSGQTPFIVCTGGEPLLQLDVELIRALKDEDFYISIESNGTLPVPPGIDWICISPKANADLIVTSGDELKLVYPQENIHPSQYEQLDFNHFSLQPLDDESVQKNIAACVTYCKLNPRWKLSLQTHKLIGIP